MPRRDSPILIPPQEAARLCEMYGYDQIIIIARRIGQDYNAHEAVTTCGADRENSEAARLIGEHFKYNVMKWKRDADG